MAKQYFHLVQADDWDNAKQSGEAFTPRTYVADGFTHLCADAEALVPIANNFYTGTRSLQPLR
jgi:uncharacterized protein (DUF952 family)